jgi:hypothetical protein
MRHIEVERLIEVPKSRIGDAPKESDASIYVREPTVITHLGQPIALYGDISDFDFRQLLSWCKRARFGLFRRMAVQQGKEWSLPKSLELFWGYTTGRHVYTAPPGVTRTTKDDPDIYRESIIPLYHRLRREFELHMPAQYVSQFERLTSQIRPDWRIDGGMYTQVVCNKGNVWSYHLDQSNFRDSWSSMGVFSRGCVGGNTIIPALDMRFAMQGQRFLIFEGARLIHGVTPLTKVKADAYRYSFVYYAHEQMAKMDTLEVELRKFRRSLDKRFDADYQATRDANVQKFRRKMRKSGL